MWDDLGSLIEAIRDFRTDVKKLIKTLEKVDLSEFVDEVKRLNKNLEQVDVQEAITEIRRLNNTLDRIDVDTLMNASRLINEIDFEEIQEGFKILLALAKGLTGGDKR